MKIGILTLPLHVNYGGILQAYALQRYLISLGHDACLIDISQRDSNFKKTIKQIIKSIIYNSPIILNKGVNGFIEKHIQPRTEYINLINDIDSLKKHKFDAYIVGSDQVWRAEYCRDLKKRFFLDFEMNESTKRISYAASFGVETWDYDNETTSDLSKLAKKFDLISVREFSAISLCKENLGVEAIVLPDPTMLLSSSVYMKLLKEVNKDSIDEKLMLYILDDNQEKQLIIELVADKLSYESFSINLKQQKKILSRTIKQYPSVIDWIKGFSDAEYIITDSFHGCVFSIIFNKPFIAIGNKERGLTRFTSLLQMFNLENRLVRNKSDISDSLIKSEIDWKEVNTKLDYYKERSADFFEILK